MGYITSATTEYIDLHITERGRKFLLQGSLADQIVKFALGGLFSSFLEYLLIHVHLALLIFRHFFFLPSYFSLHFFYSRR